jgi:hypothetical protein
MRRYNVYWTQQFEETWRQAISEGLINAEAGEARLESLATFLSVDPRYYAMFDAPGERVDLRWVNFITAETLRIEVWYSVVEDDLCVYLESVEIIHRPQQSFPGFDV